MITSSDLSLWLAVDLDGRVPAMIDLVASGDLLIVSDGDAIVGLKRGHHNPVTKFEIGNAMIMVPASA